MASQRKHQGRGFNANPAAGGRGPKPEALAQPPRQTVGFETVNQRLAFAASILIGYTVRAQVR